MNQQKVDHEWQQIQSHLESFLGRALANDIQKIEYKPKFITHLLERSSEHQQNELQGTGC